VLGEDHNARLLMTTSYDGSASTINQMTMTRVVCNNTLNVALTDKRAAIKTRHSSVFDAAKVGRELAGLAESVGLQRNGVCHGGARHDAAAGLGRVQTLLAIPFDAVSEDISSKKMNVFLALVNSYQETVAEGTQGRHRLDRAQRCDPLRRSRAHDARRRLAPGSAVPVAQFGSGAALKAQAHSLLLAA
jgi:hypothetical protein